MEILSTAVLIGVILYQGIVNWKERKDHLRERADLMNRIMAKDLKEFALCTDRLKRESPERETAEERIRKEHQELETMSGVLSVS